jgi:hypothetical protein
LVGAFATLVGAFATLGRPARIADLPRTARQARDKRRF